VAICTYKFWARPTPRQHRRLAREFGAARWVYNRGLETISRAWRERGERVTCVDFSRQVTKLKQAEVPWLREVNTGGRRLTMLDRSGAQVPSSRFGVSDTPNCEWLIEIACACPFASLLDRVLPIPKPPWPRLTPPARTPQSGE
jgi:hypothetical protein